MDQTVKKEIELIIGKHGYSDFKWMNPKDMVVAQWVRMKCMFGCNEYGHNASCPPNVPSVRECSEFFNNYTDGIIFHFTKKVEKPEDRFAWTRKVNGALLKLEKEVFLSGYHKTFLLFMDSCNLCDSCTGIRIECRSPKSARPTPESMGVDVFATVGNYNYPIEVLPDYSRVMDRYAFLLIE